MDNVGSSEKKILLVFPMVLFAVLFVLIAIMVVYYPYNSFDSMAIDYAQIYQNHQLTDFGLWLAVMGGLPMTTVFVLILFSYTVIYKKYSSSVFILLSYAFTVVTALGAKWIFQRPRPAWRVEGLETFSSSFPSAHSAYAMMLCGLVFYLLKQERDVLSKHRLIGKYYSLSHLLWLWALLMGWSRVYLGAHFPTDVLAGWILAIVVMWMMYYGVQKYLINSQSFGK